MIGYKMKGSKITYKELKSAFQNKKIAALVGLESGHAIDSSLAILRIYFNLGVRYDII